MLTLYPAKSIITMNPSAPRAEAVLVRDGRIIEVGQRAQMTPWLDAYTHEIDDRFKDKVICPGFIDPHLHPTMAAVLLPMEFITAMPSARPMSLSSFGTGKRPGDPVDHLPFAAMPVKPPHTRSQR